MLMMLLQWLSCVWQTISENNIFSCGGLMDKNLGLKVSLESLDKGGKSSPVKTVVALYLLVFIGIVRLEFLIAIMMVLLSFLFPSSTISKAISFINPIVVLFDVIYPWC